LIQAGVDCNARDPVLQWHFAGKLRQFLKNFDENHLAKVFLGRSARSVCADHFCDQRIKLPHQRASRFIVMLERSLNQRACIRIIHVINSASTPLPMTGNDAARLQFLQLNRETNVTGKVPLRSLATEAQKSAQQNKQTKDKI
jgi:hypothetical protein